MSVVYGYETAMRDDPIIAVVERAVKLAVEFIRPEVAAILGLFPFSKFYSFHFWYIYLTNCPLPVRYTPSWLPGASFKRNALISQQYAGDMVDAPFQFVKESMASPLP